MAVVGSAFIEVSPDVRGFAEKLKKLLASIRPVLVVTAEVDAAQLARDASAAVELAQGAVRPLDVSFDVDPAALVEMTDTAVELAQGAAQALDIGFDVDPDDADPSATAAAPILLRGCVAPRPSPRGQRRPVGSASGRNSSAG